VAEEAACIVVAVAPVVDAVPELESVATELEGLVFVPFPCPMLIPSGTALSPLRIAAVLLLAAQALRFATACNCFEACEELILDHVSIL
jgi:hypothetical protein